MNNFRSVRNLRGKSVVKIKDVARETGLSISTISKYMNGIKVRKENEERIQAAINELGYQPNEFARGLRTAKTYTIGVLVYRLQNIFSGKIAGNLESYLRKKGYSIVVWSHEGKPDQAIEALRFMREIQVEGLVVEPIPGQEDIYKKYLDESTPVVSVDWPLDTRKYDSISSNTMLGIYESTEYLIEKGHQKIGLIAAGLHDSAGMGSGIDRMKGFLRAMEDYELDVRPEWVVKGDFTYQSGYEGMKYLCQQRERPTAVIVANYGMCVGAVKALHEFCIKVPDEISVVTMDDMLFSELCTPRLTAIRQPVEEISRKTAEILLRRIEGDYSDFPQNLKLHTEFIERESVKYREKNENGKEQ